VRAATMALALLGLTVTARAQQGSNLGSYGAPYQTPAITGTVTWQGGGAAAGAVVTTPDGHSATTGADGTYTLGVDVPGKYSVSVKSGAAAVGPVTVSVPDGGNAVHDFTLPAGAASPAPLRFDFGTPGSPLADGYTRVSEGTAYSPAAGFGWSAGSITSRDRGVGSPLERDFDYCASCTFLVDVPAGDYLVVLVVGDAATAHDQMRYTAEGVTLDTISTSPGVTFTRSYRVHVAGARLDLVLTDVGGSDHNAVINGLVVSPLSPRRRLSSAAP
jgi:hypothetical protein